MSVNQVPVSQVSGGVGMQNLADTTLGSSAASITFSSISQVYKDMVYILDARGDQAATAENVSGQFNSDTGANYDTQYVAGNNASAVGGNSLGQTSFAIWATIPDANAPRANTFGVAHILIPNYTGTTAEKCYVSTVGYADSTATNTYARTVAGSWRSTAAITAIKSIAGGNFVTGSRFTLQGIN